MLRKTAFWGMVALMCASIAGIAEEEKKFDWEKYGLPESTLKTCIPDTRGENDSWWIPYFKNKLKQPKHDLLFIGDSITDLWSYPSDHKYPGGLDTWNLRYKEIATNHGVTGDKTQTVLWRLTEGKQLKDYYPKHIVLLIGINNLLQGDSPEDTATGIKAILDYLLKIRPETKIMLLGIFPTGLKPDTPIRNKVKKTNELISKFADGQKVFFVDFGNAFLNPDGTATKEILRDTLHLSPRGYEIWYETMKPHLDEFLKK